MNRYKILDKKNNIFATIFILLIVGSIYFIRQNYWNNHPPYSPDINAVLLAAGNNRSQFEKVLEYYSRNPSDSLKLRAAEFLIVNMPGKYAVEYEAPFEDIIAGYVHWNERESQQEVDRVFKLGEPVIKEDIKHITADYLMNNIELSFKVWNEQPWGKNVPFDVFCEEILPYRIANEPLENWREKVLVNFSKLNRTFKQQPELTAVEACIRVNLQLPKLKLSNQPLPSMNYSMIMTALRGTCKEMTALTVFTMRALGIPVTREWTPKWPRRNVGHLWNSVYDGSGHVGRQISFMGTEAIPGISHHGARMPKSKVYRLTYARQNNINAKNVDVPPQLNYSCMKDVTEEYVAAFPFYKKEQNPVSNILPKKGFSFIHDSVYKRGKGIVLDPLPEKGAGVEIPVKYPSTHHNGYIWLATTGVNEWNITGWGETDTKTIRFGSIGREILHLPVYYENGLQTPANYPFWVDDKNHVQIFEPDTAHLRKLPVSKIASFDSTYI
ncbi:MAG: transglutaminase-like domain-containing protein, partial [Tannerella sp.]|nr:transglutaminase-like domain-containing protein [Tannerella sp.]